MGEPPKVPHLLCYLGRQSGRDLPSRNRMAKAKREKKPDPPKPPELRVLPMQLRIGDRLTDDTGEYEVIGRPPPGTSLKPPRSWTWAKSWAKWAPSVSERVRQACDNPDAREWRNWQTRWT